MAVARVVDALICGEEPASLRFLETVLTAEGYSVETFTQPTKAIVRCFKRKYKIAIISFNRLSLTQLERKLETLRLIREIDPDMPQVVICEEGTLETERRIRGEGIFYLLTPPLSTSELRSVVECAITKRGRVSAP